MPSLPSFKDATVHALSTAAETYARDLSFVPAGMFDASPMGVARTPKDFTLEVIGFNHRVDAALRDGVYETMSEDERASINHAQAQALVESSARTLAETVSGMSDDDLAAPIETPWGATALKLEFARMAVSHMLYHDGQLNYIQSLYGDPVNHWAE